MARYFTPLESTGLFEEDALERLRRVWINTLEDLVGALEAEPATTREILQVDEEGFESLKSRAKALLDPLLRTAAEEQRGRDYSKGALDPGTDEGRSAAN